MKKKNIVLALILIGTFFLVSCKTETSSETEKAADAGVVTQVYASEFAKQLYALKNPYIGNASANGLLVSELHGYFQVDNSYTTELQTTEAPFWITIRFSDKPDKEKMCKVAALFIALTDNCDEFRWSYPDRDGIPQTTFITQDFLCDTLKIEDLKCYGQSAETIQELINLIKLRTMIPDGEEKNLRVNWDAYATLDFSMEDNERKNWEVRFIKDGIFYRGGTPIQDCIYEDFDKNGQKDLCLLVAGNGVEEWDSMIYIYMNHDEVYAYPMSEWCWYFDIVSGDFDADGNTELVISANTGGNGGSGSFAKVLLKHTGSSFIEMQLPGDFTEEERQWNEAGYHMEVSYAEGEGKYQVTCPTLSESKIVQAEYTKYGEESYYEAGSYYDTTHTVGEIVGSNCRGYFQFEVIEKDGREYLAAKEYIYKEAGINDGLGVATFLFDWDNNGQGHVKEWEFEVFNQESEDTTKTESSDESEQTQFGKELSNIIMAQASVEFGTHKGYSINLLMKAGRYYTEEESLPGVGTYAENYDGNYVLQVLDSSGRILDELSLKEDNPDWGHSVFPPVSTINFPGKFELCVSDYNGDELPDFTIGTAGSSSMNVFELYTINEDGKIENISTGFASTSKEFSIFLEQTPNGFLTRTWNNAIGEEEIEYFEWDEEEGKFLEVCES